MRSIYNKGKYRNGEWAKHLRPFLKKVGNRRWRMDAKSQIESELLISNPPQAAVEKSTERIRRKVEKKVKVKIAIKGLRGQPVSIIRKFRSLKAMKNSVSRNNVLGYYIYEKV
jgi:glycerol-3-phosphate dehydrogenase